MYQPILKGKKGELDAWGKVSGARRKNMVPLFEVVAENGPEADLNKFNGYLANAFAPGDVIAIDAVQLGSSSVTDDEKKAYSWLKDALPSTGLAFRPVVHLEDDEALVRDGLAVALDGIVLRIGGTDGEPHPEEGDTTLAGWCSLFGIATTTVHLLIDFESIHGAELASQVKMADAYLRWADANGPWASVTLASGAFPSQITSVPKGVPFSIPRNDAQLWNRAKKTSPVPDLHYGDYGIRHPSLPTAGFGGRGPLPNLRYTADKDWVVWREAKLKRYPNSSFFTVCAGIVGHSSFKGAAFSWADNAIDTKSSLQPGPTGAGTGTDWITCGMNHHFELVVDRLTTGGAA